MTIKISVTSDTSLSATGGIIPIHICLSGQSYRLSQAITEFNSATSA
jgi:hypothetical protein